MLTVLNSISECFQNDKTYKVSGFKACGYRYIVGTEYVHSSSTRNISRMLRVLCFQEKEIRCGNTKLYLDFLFCSLLSLIVIGHYLGLAT